LKKLVALCASALMMFLAGCVSVAPQIGLKQEFWQQKEAGIAIVIQEVPQMDMFAAGGQGILDVAISRGVNGTMIDKLRATDVPRLKQIPANIEKQLAARGFSAKVLDKPIDMDKLPDFKGDTTTHAKKDFRGLKQPGVDRLLVVTVQRVGIQRAYYGFIPLGAPTTALNISGYMIDLNTNGYLWNHDANGSDPIADPWDTPPEFSNVIAAVSQTKERVASAFERALFSAQSGK
jgi:hypothetical protein